MPARRTLDEKVADLVRSEGARDGSRSLAQETVASVPRTVTPEQVLRGSWDVWPVLRDPGTPAAIGRGELDDRLVELHDYARRHGVGDVERAARLRLEG